MSVSKKKDQSVYERCMKVVFLARPIGVAEGLFVEQVVNLWLSSTFITQTNLKSLLLYSRK